MPTNKESSKFGERRNGFVSDIKNNSKKVNRYEGKADKWANQSSFLDSILDRSSCIFSVKSKRTRELGDVRKKVEDAWNVKAAVLYDDDFDFTFKPKNKGVIKKLSKEQSDDADLVKIGNEISRFLTSDRSIFDVESVDSKYILNNELPCFNSTNLLP
jgi:hypothetical protein